MVKIILAIDDFNESTQCQILLKKLGFDVISINKDSQFRSATLGYLPDIVIASFKTKNVDGMMLGIEAKRLISKPRVLLLYPAAAEPKLAKEASVAFDFLLSSPVDYEQLIKRTADMAKLDQKMLHDKYLKLTMRRPTAQGSNTTYGGKDITDDKVQPRKPAPISSVTSEIRNRKYQEFLSKVTGDPTTRVIDHKVISEKVALLELSSPDDAKSIEAINAEKLEFAKALFKKP